MPQKRSSTLPVSGQLHSFSEFPDFADIRRGLRHGEFLAYVQPKFDLASDAVSAVEVLARWKHPAHGVLAPGVFIPLIAGGPLLDELLLQMLKQGLACQYSLHRQGRQLTFAFNLNLMQLADSALVDQLVSHLQKHPLPLSGVTFEITEDGPATVPLACIRGLERLRQLGVKLSMDDYGTGHSSLLRLCELEFDEVKLAAEFTRHIVESRRYRCVVRSTIALACELGLRVVVEGIETQAQCRCLQALGAQVGQGYLRARPLDARHLGQWLATQH